MADVKPWEKYAAPASADTPDGPWAKYGAPAAAPAPQGPQEAMSAADVLSGAVSNFLPSAGQFAKDLVQPVLHPIDTANAIGDIAGGVAAKAGIGDHDQGAADAVGQFFAQRYGGIENVKRTMAQDPVGFLSDLATVFSGGAVAGAKAGGIVGKVASVAGKAADIIDPAMNAARAVTAPAKAAGWAARQTTGFLTGVGPKSVKELVQSGRDGNAAALEQMRGGGSYHDPVDDARAAYAEIGAERGPQYEKDMAPVFADKTPLSFKPIFQAIGDARGEVYRNGNKVDVAAADALDQATQLVKDWRTAQTRTPGDFDALNRRLDDLKVNAANPFTGRTVKKVADAVADEIARVRPEYRTGQLGYANRTQAYQELGREMSLLPGTTDATAGRKLYSAMRNNVSTGFGAREQLLAELAARRPELPGMLAGGEMSGVMPRGLAKYAAGGGAMYGLMTPAGLPIAAATLLASSPRVVGETAYKIGQAARGVDKTAAIAKKLTGLDKLTPQQRALLRRALTNQVGRDTAPVTDAQRKQRGY